MVWPEANHPRAARQWLLVFLCLPMLASAEPRLVDRSVALIDGRVLTLSELQFETRVTLVFAGGVGAAFEPLETGILRKVLDLVIGQRLAVAEADKLKAYLLEEGELERALAAFAARLAGPAEVERFLKTHGADASMLAAVLTRKLRTERMLEGKLKLKAQVSEVELRNLLVERADLRGLSLAAARQRVFDERFKALTVEELGQLRKAASVRLLGPFAAGQGAEDAGSAAR